MTKKEIAIKAITEMDISLLDVVLDDKLAFMSVPKKLFLDSLNKEFKMLREIGINKFENVYQGVCQQCFKGCGGYTFLTSEHHFLDIVIQEKNNDIEDMFLCSSLKNVEKIEKKYEIDFSFKDEQKADYNLSPELLFLQRRIEKALLEFKEFENEMTEVDTFLLWESRCAKIQKAIGLRWFTYGFMSPFHSLFINVQNVKKLISYHNFAKKVLNEFRAIDILDEEAVIDWLIKYEHNELFIHFGYDITENWEKTNLIKFKYPGNLEKNVLIDIKKYKESVEFSELYANLYYEYSYKYDYTKEQFEKYGSFNGDLSQHLAAHGVFIPILRKYGFFLKEESAKFI